jgi:predicted ArsR family transcriptional regulator
MLHALKQSLVEAAQSDQVDDQVSDQVKRLLWVLKQQPALKAGELMQQLGLAHRPTFRSNYLNPALSAGLVEMTDAASPRSPVQKYRLTAQGRALVELVG